MRQYVIRLRSPHLGLDYSISKLLKQSQFPKRKMMFTLANDKLITDSRSTCTSNWVYNPHTVITKEKMHANKTKIEKCRANFSKIPENEFRTPICSNYLYNENNQTYTAWLPFHIAFLLSQNFSFLIKKQLWKYFLSCILSFRRFSKFFQSPLPIRSYFNKLRCGPSLPFLRIRSSGKWSQGGLSPHHSSTRCHAIKHQSPCYRDILQNPNVFGCAMAFL